ncbi:hypothetical protein [Saccharicrinis fermentans]|nr:hypothetical protein [Saccharicrinis fermentans]
MKKSLFLLVLVAILISCQSKHSEMESPRQVSGIYPHLAMYNSQGECGTGAIVSWADRLWVITYAPHYPVRTDDMLFEITPDLKQIERKESIGGTPANRMIHKESQQLFIGPYAIDADRNVRAIPYTDMPGRHTGNARHLTNPQHMIYYGTMEEGFYEVDVHTLKHNELYKDRNNEKGKIASRPKLSAKQRLANLPGAHGKGLYSGQGVMVFSNNGEAGKKAKTDFDTEAGVLAEWDGKDWKVARRNQFVEVTGPGGIYGNENPESDPIWATGWDSKSIILGVRNATTGWDFYRLPKASHSYDGAHGWNTEWPRIRNIGTTEKSDFLMTMHGMFWKFPGNFTAENSAGIRPRSSYLKVIGDFTRWNDQLVFGCDDSAQKEFLNKRKQKGDIEGPGQSNSNLWFTSIDKPDHLGPNTASGSVWLNDEVAAHETSEPMLFSGWPKRMAWVLNGGDLDTKFVFEVDKMGNQHWEELKTIALKAGASASVEFTSQEKGEWIRVRSTSKTLATLSFNYSDIDERQTKASPMFTGLANVNETNVLSGLLYGLGDNRRALGVWAKTFENGVEKESGYYELDDAFHLVKKEDTKTKAFIKEKFAIPENVIDIQESSVLIVDDKDRRWRLPLGNEGYEALTNKAQLRICREVATERDLFSCSGTFYELPAENADGFAKIRPISSHNFRIHDYASYRGMLVMTGLHPKVNEGDHIVRSEDGKAALWVGAIDDLWEMGKPVGKGGPWKNTAVKTGEVSDPYLIAFYDKKELTLSHNSNDDVTFTIQVEPVGHGPWMDYKEVTVKAGEEFNYTFPDAFQARWIRFKTDTDCTATSWLVYR